MAQHKLKPWEKKKRSLYRIEAFSPNKTILIVCEGQTEAEYFKSFDVVSISIVCQDSGGRTKRQLVEYCEKVIRHKKITFDEIWCVFDMDIKEGEAELADFDNAIKSAKEKKYKIAYSNDAFELWFYLHFSYTDLQHLRTFYYEQLSSFFGYNYEKFGKKLDNCKKNYSRLLAHTLASQKNAIKNAEKLHLNQKHLPYSRQNPVTTVYELVTELNKYLRGTKHS